MNKRLMDTSIIIGEILCMSQNTFSGLATRSRVQNIGLATSKAISSRAFSNPAALSVISQRGIKAQILSQASRSQTTPSFKFQSVLQPRAPHQLSPQSSPARQMSTIRTRMGEIVHGEKGRDYPLLSRIWKEGAKQHEWGEGKKHVVST